MNIMSPRDHGEHAETMPLRHRGDVDGVIHRLWRNRGAFALGFAVPVLIALAVLLFARPAYIASGSIMVGEQEPTSSGASPAWVQKLGDPADMESQLLVLKSNRTLRLVLSRPGVIDAAHRECRLGSAMPRFSRDTESCEGAAFDSPVLLQHIERRYGARAIGRSRVIAVSYESPLPDVAFVMANALLVSYLEDQRAQNARSRTLASGWILKEGERVETNTANGAARQFYGDLHKEVSDIETERRILVNGGRLVSLAETPRLPYFPKAAPVMAAGATLGLIFGVLAAFFAGFVSNPVGRAGDLEDTTGSPVLGQATMAGARTGQRDRHANVRAADIEAETI